jgi:anti-sigma regulatory factor (Ser/Thr protein kinase)
LAATARAAGLARQATHEALASWGAAHLEEAAVLLVSELVTNAVRHAHTGGSALVLRLEADGSGLGFVLIEALADSWGVRKATIGKAVWAELDTRPDGEPET